MFSKKQFYQLLKNEWILFLPFLLFYFFIVVFFSKDYYIGDEPRYLMFAENVLQGFYSPPPPEINLWNGPGYPLIISLTKLLNLPEISIRLFNALWLYLALILVYKAIKLTINKNFRFTPVTLLGTYLPIYVMLPKILTECFTWFLISLITYLFVKYLNKQIKLYHILLLSFFLFYLMITKVVFAYAIFFSMIILGIWYLKNRKKEILNAFFIFFLAILMSIPYLNYTYKLTGKLFYWSNAGSLSLYTMSTPYPDENGSFMTPKYMAKNPNHQKEIDSIVTKLPALQMDEALTKAALRNIKKHPAKYFKNWLSNLGRLFIGTPFFMKKNTAKSKLFAFINILIISYLMYINWQLFRLRKSINYPLKILLILFLIYLAGSSLVSAYPRMFYITLPFWTTISFSILYFKKQKRAVSKQ